MMMPGLQHLGLSKVTKQFMLVTIRLLCLKA